LFLDCDWHLPCIKTSPRSRNFRWNVINWWDMENELLLECALVLLGLTALFAFRYRWNCVRLRRELRTSREACAVAQESEQRYRSVLQAAQDGIVITDLDGLVRSANPAVLIQLGIGDEKDVLGTDVVKLLHQVDRQQSRDSIQRMFQGESYGVHDFRGLSKDGSELYVSVNAEFILDPKGERCGIVFVGRNVSERKAVELALSESNRRLSELSITDGLTEIANRRHFDEVFATEHARHIRTGRTLSLIMLDVDHFKRFNDNFGHLAGDECLKSIAQVLRCSARRSSDLAARYGGEEFACILPETDYEGAMCVAEKIRTGILRLAIPHESNSPGAVVSASLGVVSVRCFVGKNRCELISCADEMLYRAKAQGRDRICSMDLSIPAVGPTGYESGIAISPTPES